MKKRIIIIGTILIIIALVIVIIPKNKEYFTIIVDEVICKSNINKFYEDEKYVYYLTCHTKDDITIKFSETNVEMNIEEALKLGKITINDLKGKIEYFKESKSDK